MQSPRHHAIGPLCAGDTPCTRTIHVHCRTRRSTHTTSDAFAVGPTTSLQHKPFWATCPLHLSPSPSSTTRSTSSHVVCHGPQAPSWATRPFHSPPLPLRTTTSTTTHVTCHGHQAPGHPRPPDNWPTWPRQSSHRAGARNPAGRTPPAALLCQGPAECTRRCAPGSPAWCASLSESPDGYWDSSAF